MSERYGSAILEGVDEPPAPTIKPARCRMWWLFRLYGLLILRPVRRMWRMADKVFPKFRDKVRDWLWRGGQGRPRLRRFLEDDHSCPCCGDQDWLEDEVYVGEEGKRVELFECVNSGQSYYGEHWWEGWKFCFRCGCVDWHSDST